MDDKSCCDHSNCTHANTSVCQTISEMDWERGLWNAAFNGEEERVKSLIDKARNVKELVNTPDNGGYTSLHYAARKGHINICKILLNYGANVNAHTNGGATPLHKAAVGGKLETVKFLIQSGAQIDTQDADGQTVLHKAVENKYMNLFDYLVQAHPELASIKDFKGLSANDYTLSTPLE